MEIEIGSRGLLVLAASDGDAWPESDVLHSAGFYLP